MTGRTKKKRRPRGRLQRKYRIRRMLLFVGIVLVAFGAVALFSSATATQEVEITGTQTISKTTIRQIADAYLNKSYLAMDKKSLLNRLEQLPYVKRAEIGLSFPHTLTIAIEEETPAAQLYSGDGYLLVNENFKALDKTRSYHTNLIKITGIPASGVRLGQVAFRETGNEKKIEMIQELFRSEMKKDINTLAVLDQGIKLSFSDGTVVHIRSFNDAAYKVNQLEEIRKEMKLKDETYREIYLDQGDHPIAVKPSSLDEAESGEDSELDVSNETTKGEAIEGDDRDDKEEKRKDSSSNEAKEKRSLRTLSGGNDSSAGGSRDN